MRWIPLHGPPSFLVFPSTRSKAAFEAWGGPPGSNGEGPGPSSLNLCGWRHPKSQGGGGRSRAEPAGRGVLCGSKGGTAPGEGSGQSGEAVITGDVLLETPGEGSQLEHRGLLALFLAC